jgi:hypothetical protein
VPFSHALLATNELVSLEFEKHTRGIGSLVVVLDGIYRWWTWEEWTGYCCPCKPEMRPLI